MRQQISKLMAIDNSDEDVRRRGFNVLALALGLSLLALLFLPQTLFQPNKASLAAIVVSLIIYGLAIALARSGRVTPAAWILTMSITVAVIGVILSGGMIAASPFYLLLSVLIASLVLRPAEIWLVLAVNLAALTASLNLLPSALLSDPRDSQALISAFALLGIITLIGFLGARSTTTALRTAQHARAETETAAATLEHVNSELETKIAARTAELAEALESQRAQATELQASLATQQSLNETLNAMSLPIIPVRADVLVAPLVGNMDGSRAQKLIGNVLEQVQARHARAIILDVTGVAVVDTQLAQTLLRAANATRLLGASTMLVGIRPEVAQTLVSLGADLTSLHIAATLQDGLASIASL